MADMPRAPVYVFSVLRAMGTVDAEIRVVYAENPELSKVLYFKPTLSQIV